MAETIYFTDVGEGIHEGRLVKWAVKEGDQIKEDQPLVEIETDKAIVEVPSSKTGVVLALYAQVGQTLHVGDPLASVGKKGEAAPKLGGPAQPTQQTIPLQQTTQANASRQAQPPSPIQQLKSAQSASASQPPQKPQPPSQLDRMQSSPPAPSIQAAQSQAKMTPGQKRQAQQLQAPQAAISQQNQMQPASRQPLQQLQQPQSSQPNSLSSPGLPVSPYSIKATPFVRKMAHEVGVDLSSLQGTGESGRITAQDVLAAKGGFGQAAPVAAQAQPQVPQRRIRVVSKVGGPEIRKPFSEIRRKIAERLEYSHSIPNVTQIDEADVTELWALREKEKGRFDDKGVKLTLLPFVIKALCKALKEFPDFNASLDEEAGEVILKKYYDVGIAVETPVGLMVPVLKGADKKSVFDVAQETQKLAIQARDRSIKLDDLSGSTFTVTNIGSVGGIYANPIINPPEAAILGVMRMQTRPAFAPAAKEKKTKTKAGKQAKPAALKIEARLFLPLCLTFDHRLNDGAAAAAFLLEVKKHLENPDAMLVDDI